MKSLASLFCCCATVLAGWAAQAIVAPSLRGAPIFEKVVQTVVEKNVAVKMRDGTVLRADVLLPSAEGRFPVLVYRTPYGKDNASSAWSTFNKAVARGYAVVIQDVRGRYASEGELIASRCHPIWRLRARFAPRCTFLPMYRISICGCVCWM